VNTSAVALRFLFAVTLGRANLATQLARVHYPRRLPRVLSREDVGRLIEAAPGPGLKYKAALSVAYGAGLRAAEVDMPLPSIAAEANSSGEAADDTLDPPCPCCGGRMRIIEVFKRGQMPKHQPSPRPTMIRIDTS
jgi:hypothetical protein